MNGAAEYGAALDRILAVVDRSSQRGETGRRAVQVRHRLGSPRLRSGFRVFRTTYMRLGDARTNCSGRFLSSSSRTATTQRSRRVEASAKAQRVRAVPHCRTACDDVGLGQCSGSAASIARSRAAASGACNNPTLGLISLCPHSFVMANSGSASTVRHGSTRQRMCTSSRVTRRP